MTSRESKPSSGGRVETETAPSSTSSEPVDVEIRGQTLAIRSNHDPEFVHRLAEHIDAKVSDLQSMAPAVSMSKLLMLASMTVAEELFEARQEIDELRAEIGDRADAMRQLLDKVDMTSDPSHHG